MLYDHITISCQEIIRSHYQMKPKDTKRRFKPLPGHPKANIRLRVRHIQTARKHIITGRKRAQVKDDRKSFGEKLRVVVSYTFY